MELLEIKSAEQTELAVFLHSRVVGQEDAIAAIVAQWDKVQSGMADPTRPISTMLFLGPTGVGKTKVVEAFAEYLFGENEKPLKINCGEYTHDHQVARLIGSPVGYHGSDEEPYLSHRKVEERKTKDGKKLNVILFDEIEKAGSGPGQGQSLQNLMLAILDRGELGLSRGANPVNFKNTIIFLTSNLAARELLKAKTQEEKRMFAEEAARQFFTPEQFNRLDDMVVFNPLTQEQITLIADLEITEVGLRAKMELELDEAARDMIAKEGYDARYGARHLRRVVDKSLTRPIASLLARKTVSKGCRLRVEKADGSRLQFFRMEGLANMPEERTTAAPLPVTQEVQAFRSQGYVKRMLDRQFAAWNTSHGALVYRYLKALGFKPMYADEVIEGLKANGFTTSNAGGPEAAIKYVLNDWVKKQWAVRDGSGSNARYVLKD